MFGSEHVVIELRGRFILTRELCNGLISLCGRDCVGTEMFSPLCSVKVRQVLLEDGGWCTTCPHQFILCFSSLNDDVSKRTTAIKHKQTNLNCFN